jgi:hypothetical protein
MMPNIKGASSDVRVTPRNPYRGRIGMQVAPGRWAPYRQHSLYMGFLTVCFAFLGVLGVVRKKRDSGLHESGLSDNRAEIIFWSVSAVVVLLIAFGAFTPFYRLVFALPMGDYIRCPVKLVHLVEWCVAVLAGFGVANLLSMSLTRKAHVVISVAIGMLLLVNMLNLAVEDAKFCAVDPVDTIRVTVAKETGTPSLGFAMDANARIGEDEYLFAGGNAFRDNKALKDALATGAYAPVSFWNFQGGRLVKTARERAGFALLKSSKPMAKNPDGTLIPGITATISLFASCLVCVAGFMKLKGRSFAARQSNL